MMYVYSVMYLYLIVDSIRYIDKTKKVPTPSWLASADDDLCPKWPWPPQLKYITLRSNTYLTVAEREQASAPVRVGRFSDQRWRWRYVFRVRLVVQPLIRSHPQPCPASRRRKTVVLQRVHCRLESGPCNFRKQNRWEYVLNFPF